MLHLLRPAVQGIVGSTPWNALVFTTFWFQLVGFSDLQASILLAAFLAANAAGRLLPGVAVACRRLLTRAVFLDCFSSGAIVLPVA